VHADERRTGLHISHDKGDSLFDATVPIRSLASKAVDAELAPAGREIRGSNLLYVIFGHTNIIAVECLDDVAEDSAFASASRPEGEDGVLLRGNRCTVAGGGAEVPVFESCQTLVINVGTKAL
jgi:hypothetical protein